MLGLQALPLVWSIPWCTFQHRAGGPLAGPQAGQSVLSADEEHTQPLGTMCCLVVYVAQVSDSPSGRWCSLWRDGFGGKEMQGGSHIPTYQCRGWKAGRGVFLETWRWKTRAEDEKSAGESVVFTKNDVKQQKTFRVKAPVWNWLHAHPWYGFCVRNGKPKVDRFDLEVALANKHDVVWFDVGMQDADIAEGIQSTEELRQERKILLSE